MGHGATEPIRKGINSWIMDGEDPVTDPGLERCKSGTCGWISITPLIAVIVLVKKHQLSWKKINFEAIKVKLFVEVQREIFDGGVLSSSFQADGFFIKVKISSSGGASSKLIICLIMQIVIGAAEFRWELPESFIKEWQRRAVLECWRGSASNELPKMLKTSKNIYCATPKSNIKRISFQIKE
jgi:hypothetical protein